MSDKIIKVDTAVSSAIGLADALGDKSLATNRCPAVEKFYSFDEKDPNSNIAITTVQCELQRGHEGKHKGEQDDETWSETASEYLLKNQKVETIKYDLCFARTPVATYGAPLTPAGIRCEKPFNHIGDHVGGIDMRLRWQGCDARKDNRRCSLQRSHTSMLHISGDDMWGGERVVNSADETIGEVASAGQYLTAEQIASYAAGYAVNMVAPVRRQKPLRSSYDFQIEFGPGIIQPQESLVFAAMPERYFRGERLVCVPPATPGLFITSILVGRKLQFPNDRRPIPVESYMPNSLGRGMRWDTCQPGLILTISVENRANIPLDFQATLFGKAA